MPIKTFAVLWCLYDDHVSTRRFAGLSINTSKQSIITATDCPNDSWKHIGMVLCKFSLSGHKINGFNFTDNHFDRNLDTVDW